MSLVRYPVVKGSVATRLYFCSSVCLSVCLCLCVCVTSQSAVARLMIPRVKPDGWLFGSTRQRAPNSPPAGAEPVSLPADRWSVRSTTYVASSQLAAIMSLIYVVALANCRPEHTAMFSLGRGASGRRARPFRRQVVNSSSML